MQLFQFSVDFLTFIVLVNFDYYAPWMDYYDTQRDQIIVCHARNSVYVKITKIVFITESVNTTLTYAQSPLLVASLVQFIALDCAPCPAKFTGVLRSLTPEFPPSLDVGGGVALGVGGGVGFGVGGFTK
ncbi:hypothetical protein HUJ04_012996 [Dendroctonus ponderosae]|nr:hypothetical protein HUJ04_012996 [Dendroctonus ponderosae]